jgi:hypothetical protein
VSRTPDFFPDTKPPPRKLLRVIDGSSSACCDDGTGEPMLVKLGCSRCAYESDWITITKKELREGFLCPQCTL